MHYQICIWYHLLTQLSFYICILATHLQLPAWIIMTLSNSLTFNFSMTCLSFSNDLMSLISCRRYLKEQLSQQLFINLTHETSRKERLHPQCSVILPQSKTSCRLLLCKYSVLNYNSYVRGP